jgi:hypothetical protein
MIINSHIEKQLMAGRERDFIAAAEGVRLAVKASRRPDAGAHRAGRRPERGLRGCGCSPASAQAA